MKVASNRKQYCLHPGYVFSRSDGDEHFISFNRLLMLWGVPRGRCICWDYRRPATCLGRHWDDYIHLTPRYDGNYVLDADGLPPGTFGGYHTRPLALYGWLPVSWEQFAAIKGWRMKQRNFPEESQHLIDLGFDFEGLANEGIAYTRARGEGVKS